MPRHPLETTIRTYSERTLPLLGNGIHFNRRIVMTTMHTAMMTMLKANNSVRHLPLAQLEGLAARRGVAQIFRKICANV